MQGYLKNWRGEELLDQFNRRIPVEHFHNCDEYGCVPCGEKSRIFSPREEPRIIGEEIRVLPGRIVGSSPSPATYSPPLTRTRTPVTSRFRRIGSSPAGVLGDIQAWWTGLKAEHKWAIGGVGGLAVIGIVVAATRKGEAETGLRKV